MFSFFPLCHIAEKIQTVGVAITQHYLVTYASSFDKVSEELPDVQPTLLLSVPRLWEKDDGRASRRRWLLKWAPSAKLMDWALDLGTKVAETRFANRAPNPIELLKLKAADTLVLGKVRKKLGLDNLHTAASGAAALPAHVARWFRTIGIEILEDFGQTESTGVICMTERGVESSGTVGRAVAGIEVKIAEDGEVLCRGRNVFVGYFKDEAATAEVLRDGWLYTGDLGELDARGLLRIRGRKKEILKTSGGKMVAPLPIEEALKAASIISQVCMVGDGRKYVAALITLTEASIRT